MIFFPNCFQLICRNKSTLPYILIQRNFFMQKHGKIHYMRRIGPVQELRQCFCIFHSSSFSCDSGHNMCIIDQSCFMKPVDCLICLCQIMIFFHKFQHIIQSTLDSKIQMLYLFSGKHFQLFLAFM